MEALELATDDDTNGVFWLEGQLCIDLVNTRTWPDREAEYEWFDRPENAARWAIGAGLLDEAAGDRWLGWCVARPGEASAALDEILRLREVIVAVLRPLAERDVLEAEAVEALNAEVARVLAARYVDPATRAWAWREPATLAEVFRPVVLDAAEFLVSADPRCLRTCGPCGWLYYDRSRNQKRRWCDMARCGSREKARRYYRRKTQGRDG